MIRLKRSRDGWIVKSDFREIGRWSKEHPAVMRGCTETSAVNHHLPELFVQGAFFR